MIEFGEPFGIAIYRLSGAMLIYCGSGDTLGGRLSFAYGGHCIDALKFVLVFGGIDATINFLFLALPIPMVLRLRTTTIQKVVIMAIFVVGLTYDT